MKKTRAILLSVILSFSVLIAGLLPSQTVEAASNPCGYSYYQVNNSSSSYGNLIVYKSGNYLCGVQHTSFLTRNIGGSQWTTIRSLDKYGNVRRDEGKYAYYAGPVYVYAPYGQCVSFSGSVMIPSRYVQWHGVYQCNVNY